MELASCHPSDTILRNLVDFLKKRLHPCLNANNVILKHQISLCITYFHSWICIRMAFLAHKLSSITRETTVCNKVGWEQVWTAIRLKCAWYATRYENAGDSVQCRYICFQRENVTMYCSYRREF